MVSNKQLRTIIQEEVKKELKEQSSDATVGLHKLSELFSQGDKEVSNLLMNDMGEFRLRALKKVVVSIDSVFNQLETLSGGLKEQSNPLLKQFSTISSQAKYAVFQLNLLVKNIDDERTKKELLNIAEAIQAIRDTAMQAADSIELSETEKN